MSRRIVGYAKVTDVQTLPPQLREGAARGVLAAARAVVRAVADAAGASAIFDAGDDTSTGSSWEAFSLDSLDAAFKDFDERWAVAGNHDHGGFVASYQAGLGWRVPDGEVIDGPGGSKLLGASDPSSSGLGSGRQETGLSAADVADKLADTACDSSTRIATLLVHAASLGTPALERGCVDLVVAGDAHVQSGPDRVVGTNGKTGWTYTNGTTGGAAYAFAMGSKPRRTAGISLITYAQGRPAGIQGVTLETNGTFRVDPYVELTY
jgi:hypothetical protein